MLTDKQKEELRHTVLGVLGVRHPNAFNEKQILNRVAMEVDFPLDQSDIVAALEFLKGLGMVEKIPDDFGASAYWNATSAGVLKLERSKNEPKR